MYARLARLTQAQASAADVESLLDEQPVTIPALDIVVEDLELRGKRLGRVEVEAVNRGAGAVARDGGHPRDPSPAPSNCRRQLRACTRNG